MLSHPEGLTANVNLATEFTIIGLRFLSLSSLVFISFKKISERHFTKKEFKDNLKTL